MNIGAAVFRVLLAKKKIPVCGSQNLSAAKWIFESIFIGGGLAAQIFFSTVFPIVSMPLKCRETANKMPISEQEKLTFQYALENGGIITAQVTELLGIKQRRAREILVKMVEKSG